MKCAVTALFPAIVIDAGFADPERLPLQWSKTQPGAAVAVSVTDVPSLYVCEPAGGLVQPLPATPILSVDFERAAWVKCAVTDLFAVIVMLVGFADPYTLPLQWSNAQPGAGVPPNTEDTDYDGLAGTTEAPGLVVIRFVCTLPPPL